jgi:hypothetical protein
MPSPILPFIKNVVTISYIVINSYYLSYLVIFYNIFLYIITLFNVTSLSDKSYKEIDLRTVFHHRAFFY